MSISKQKEDFRNGFLDYSDTKYDIEYILNMSEEWKRGWDFAATGRIHVKDVQNGYDDPQILEEGDWYSIQIN